MKLQEGFLKNWPVIRILINYAFYFGQAWQKHKTLKQLGVKQKLEISLVQEAITIVQNMGGDTDDFLDAIDLTRDDFKELEE